MLAFIDIPAAVISSTASRIWDLGAHCHHLGPVSVAVRGPTKGFIDNPRYKYCQRYPDTGKNPVLGGVAWNELNGIILPAFPLSASPETPHPLHYIPCLSVSSECVLGVLGLSITLILIGSMTSSR
jgi:hypothetical protein